MSSGFDNHDNSDVELLSSDSSSVESKSKAQQPRNKKQKQFCGYNPDWEKTISWVSKYGNDNTKAKCKFCAGAVVTVKYDGINALTQHEAGKKHKENVKAAATTKRVSSFFVVKNTQESDKVTVAELTHIFHSVKHHISILAQDCAMRVMKEMFEDSEIATKMSAGRTKVTAIINDVLYPLSISLVLNDLKNDVPFSVATDASNRGNRKFFPVVIQYFDIQKGICHKVLDFFENAFEDSRSVKDQVCRVLQENDLSWRYVSAYSADNASVNFGVNNSVFQKLVDEENAKIIPAHCSNHIIHNCAKHALKLMSFDIENVVIKIFSEFSNSSKKREELKECFIFCESEFLEVIRHVPTRWLSLFKAVERVLLSWRPLKAYFLALGSDSCPIAIWKLLKDQENEMSSDELPTISEIYLYFTHYFMSSFQETLLLLEKQSTASCDLYLIMDKFRQSLNRKLDDKFFGMKVRQSLLRNYLPCDVAAKFTLEALGAYERAIKYLEKWFPFQNTPYCCLQPLSIGNADRIPTLDEILEIWKISPWGDSMPPDDIFDELGALGTVFNSLQGNSIEKWSSFLTKESAPQLLKIIQFVMSIPVSNASVERVFSVMRNVWTDERNRLGTETLKSELCIFFNVPYSCSEFKVQVSNNKALLRAAQSSQKYKHHRN